MPAYKAGVRPVSRFVLQEFCFLIIIGMLNSFRIDIGAYDIANNTLLLAFAPPP